MSNFGLSSPSLRLCNKKTGWQTAVLFLVAIVASLVYLRVGLARVFYPFALDLVEEDMLLQAWRIAQGQPVFVPPNADFVPQVYMPLFTWLGGQLLKVADFAFWPLRLISFLSTVGTAVLIFYIGLRESGSKIAAFAGSALFLVGFRLVGGWHDLARVDALFAFLSLAGLVVLVYRLGGTRRITEEAQRFTEISVVLGAVLLGLSFLAKQNGLLMAAVAGGYLLVSEIFSGAERQAQSNFFKTIRTPALFLTVFLLLAGLPLLILQQGSGGWFGFYVVDIAYLSPIDLGRLRNIFVWELGAGMGVLVGLFGATAVAGLFTINRHWFGLLRFVVQHRWLLFGGTAVFISVAGRSTIGGNLNNWLFGYAFLCLAPALSWGTVFEMKEGLAWGWLIAVLVQFVLALFPLNDALPQTFLPTAAMEQAGKRLLAQVEATDGEVWLLMHPSYAVQASKRPYAHLQSLWHARRRGVDPLPADLIMLIENQQFAQIISDESDFFETEPLFLELLQTHYEIVGTLPPDLSPPTLSGPIIRPLTVYAPRR